MLQTLDRYHPKLESRGSSRGNRIILGRSSCCLRMSSGAQLHRIPLHTTDPGESITVRFYLRIAGRSKSSQRHFQWNT